MQFLWHRISANDRNWRDAYDQISAAVPTAALWGAFWGLFGLGTNELYVITSSDGEPPAIEATPDFQVTDTCLFEPTVRPTQRDPLTRSGLYVFRFFEIAHANVDEIATLSKEAWTHFEDSEGYAAEPQALFAQVNRSAYHGRMLLITWYDGFESWQTSRTPHPDATARFRRRHELMSRAIPYATRLITPNN